MSFYRNAEGYSDPTAGKALSNITAQERRRQKPTWSSRRFPRQKYKKPNADLGDPYQALANAIVLQAVDEYRDALRTLRKTPDNSEANATIKEIDQFFRSEWFIMLTDVNGELLIRKIKEEAK